MVAWSDDTSRHGSKNKILMIFFFYCLGEGRSAFFQSRPLQPTPSSCSWLLSSSWKDSALPLSLCFKELLYLNHSSPARKEKKDERLECGYLELSYLSWRWRRKQEREVGSSPESWEEPASLGGLYQGYPPLAEHRGPGILCMSLTFLQVPCGGISRPRLENLSSVAKASSWGILILERQWQPLCELALCPSHAPLDTIFMYMTQMRFLSASFLSLSLLLPRP